MKNRLVAAISALLLVAPAVSLGATAQITWQNAENYSDIEPAQETRARFQERILVALEEIFVQQAEALPEDYTLYITMNDVDLAGQVEPIQTGTGLEHVRVIRSAYRPSMEFDYELHNAEGDVLERGDASIRGRHVPGQHYVSRLGQQEALRFEKDMIERWFEQTFDYE